MRQMDLLWDLQRLDSRIGELERQLAVYTNKTKLKQLKVKFDKEKDLFEKNDRALKEAVKSSKSNRVKVEELKFGIQKTEEKLYSGAVSSVKQLEGMQKNLDEMQKGIETLEIDYRDIQDRRKNLERQVKISRSKLKKYKNTFDHLKEKYNKGELDAGLEYEELIEKREKLIKKIDKRILDRYERVRLGNDTAVVEIVDGKCAGCHMEVSVVYSEKLREDELINCETCGRILYYKKNSEENDE